MPDFSETFNTDVAPDVLEVLGDDVTWTAAGGSPVVVRVSFDIENFMDVADGPMNVAVPMLATVVSNMPGVAVGDAVVKGSDSYVVDEPPQLLGDGWMILRLRWA